MLKTISIYIYNLVLIKLAIKIGISRKTICCYMFTFLKELFMRNYILKIEFWKKITKNHTHVKPWQLPPILLSLSFLYQDLNFPKNLFSRKLTSFNKTSCSKSLHVGFLLTLAVLCASSIIGILYSICEISSGMEAWGIINS